MLSKLNCKFSNTVTTNDTKADVMWINKLIVNQERAFPTQFDSRKIELEGKKIIVFLLSSWIISKGLISYLLFYYLRDSVIEYTIFIWLLRMHW